MIRLAQHKGKVCVCCKPTVASVIAKGRASPVFEPTCEASVCPGSDGAGLLQWDLFHSQQPGAFLWVDQPWRVPFSKILLVFRTEVFYKLGQTESLWKSYQKSSPRGSFHQWFLKFSVAPEPRKQHCYQGVRKHWTQFRNGVLMRPKGAVLRAHLRDKQAGMMRSAPGFLHVWKKEWTWHLKLGPCILATWQLSSWQGWVSLLYPTRFFVLFIWRLKEL